MQSKWTGVLVFALLLGCSAQQTGAPPQTMDIPPGVEHPDWLAKDLQRVRQLKTALARPQLTVEDLLADLGGCDVREDRDLGFGARSLHLAAYGGYSTVWIRILAQRGTTSSVIASLECVQSGSSDSFETVAPTLEKAWDLPLQKIDTDLVYKRENSSAVNALREQTMKALEGVEPAAVDGELAQAFARLSSPHEELILGTSYSIDGSPPPGAEEIELLRNSGRVDLLRAVLRGLNPEGRVYAAAALQKLGALDAQDERAIEKLRALPVELKICEGCLLSLAQFDAALAHLAE